MIKLKKEKDFLTKQEIEMIYCDNCGEGMSLNENLEIELKEKRNNNKKEKTEIRIEKLKTPIEKFLEIHETCKKQKNNGLEFLKNAENFK